MTPSAVKWIAAVICFVLLSATGFSQSVTSVDKSIRPGDDFYRYANGPWLASTSIPSGESIYDTRAELKARTAQRVRDLILAASAAPEPKGSVSQKVGDYYDSFIDTNAIEAQGLKPLAADLAAISAIASRTSLSAYLGGTLNSEVDGLVANSDHVLGVWINQGFDDADHNLPHIWQGGLGLPDRDNYFDSSPKWSALRAQYQAHIAAMLKLAGITDADQRAARVLALETKIAQAFAPDADAAEVSRQNNPWKRGDFAVKAPGMDWSAYFQAAGLEGQSDFLVWQPSAVLGVSSLAASEAIETWQDYLRLHLLEHYAAVLPKAVRDEHFNFYGRALSGMQQPPDRASDAVAATNGALGQAVGQLYTQRYFPPKAKARAQAMAANLLAAFRSRISNVKWMTPATREKALAKLAAFELFLGYPDVWIDYSTLDVVPGDALGNMRRAETFTRKHNLAMLKQPVDPIDWPLNAQVPGAVIMFSPNAEFFSAGILQPPYFDSEGDAAANYGSAGAGMAHEISHSFDELGNIYDARGRLVSWWTADDKAQFQAAATKLTEQINHDCPLADLCVNGKQAQTETVADLAGLAVAHDAYVLSLQGQADAVIGGLTGEQRFFIAFAQRWRRLQTEASLRQQIQTDTHLPAEYRSDEVRNFDAWYKAFDVKPGDRLYLKPDDRVGIW